MPEIFALRDQLITEALHVSHNIRISIFVNRDPGSRVRDKDRNDAITPTTIRNQFGNVTCN